MWTPEGLGKRSSCVSLFGVSGFQSGSGVRLHRFRSGALAKTRFPCLLQGKASYPPSQYNSPCRDSGFVQFHCHCLRITRAIFRLPFHVMKKFFVGFLLLSSVTFGQFSWTNQRPAGVGDDIWCVTFANNTFVAVTGSGKVLTSADGLTWSVQTIAQNTWLVSVTYGAGLWVVVGDKGTIFYSADLQTWSAAKAVTSSKLNGVAYSGKTFLAVGEQGVIATSSDAQNWTLRNSGTTNFLHGIIASTSSVSNGTVQPSPTVVSSFSVTGGNGTIVQSVDDGVTWNTTSANGIVSFSVPTNQGLEAIAQIRSTGDANSGQAVAVGGGGFIATFGMTQQPIFHGALPLQLTSLQSSRTVQPAAILRGLTYGASVYVAAGEQGTIFTSPDGANWTQRFSGDSPASLSTSTLLSVTYAPTLQRFVATGTNGTILVSNAAPSTLLNVATRGTVTTGDPLIGGFVITGTAPKNVLIRSIGPTLSAFAVSKPLADPVLTIYDSAKHRRCHKHWLGHERQFDCARSRNSSLRFPPDRWKQRFRTLSHAQSRILHGSHYVRFSGTGTALFEAYSP